MIKNLRSRNIPASMRFALYCKEEVCESEIYTVSHVPTKSLTEFFSRRDMKESIIKDIFSSRHTVK